MARRHPRAITVGVALLAWVGLLLFGKFVAPEGVLARSLFLLIVFVALTATFAPIAQFIGRRLIRSKVYAQRAWQHALRQGALASLAIVANLALKALDAWYWADILLIVLVVVLVELIALARK
jgi:hypothetical protein